MNILRVKDYEELSEKACDFLVDKITKLSEPVLGLATGSTPEGLYQRLVEKYNEGIITYKNVSSFNLDEYVGLTKENPNSYRFYMDDKLFNHIDILQQNIYLPNGTAENFEEECLNYEKYIQNVGNIDVQVLGLGLNGHIGFNEPGTPFTSRTHVVGLDESTRKANSRFFNSVNDVPRKAITMGIRTIMDSKEILLLVSGKQKKKALESLLYGKVTEEFPASILRKHENVTIIATEDVVGGN